MDRIKQLWEEKPLSLIMWAAILTRMVAVIFSKGYGWHDDHFLVVEEAQTWVDGNDFYKWLPWNGNHTPSGHSFFYPGLHYLLYVFLKAISITSPEDEMYITRFVNAAFSLLIVYCGYRIVEKISGVDAAKKTGLLLAILWFMPFMSVRDLVEFACIPFLALAIWLIIKYEKEQKGGWFFIAGLLLGCAMNVRFQTSLFLAGLWLALLISKQWKALIFTGLGAALAFVSFQSINDYFFWGRPFAEFQGYVKYNIDNAYNYVQNVWYSYLLVILGLLVPPMSFLWFFGYLRYYKKYLIIFLPVLLFTAFHSYFPNKQERFIIPVIPFILISGVPGWEDFVKKSKFWLSRPKLLKGFHIFFWTLNIFLLCIFTVTYSKRARVESALYLSQYPNIHSIVVEASSSDGATQIPMFYLKQWVPVYNVTTDYTPAKFAADMNAVRNSHAPLPDFVMFEDSTQLNKRVAFMKTIFPNLKYETKATPGLVDKVLYKLNSVNQNQPIYIYSTK